MDLGRMYKCKYLKLPGNYFTSNYYKNGVAGIFECGLWHHELGTSPHRCKDCRYFSPSDIIMPEIIINNDPITKYTNSFNCRIFLEPEKWKLALESNMTLGKYNKMGITNYRNVNHDEFSKLIVKLKNQDPDVIDYFSNELCDILNDKEEFVICVIPSSQKGLVDSGIRTIAERLCRPPIIDGTGVIVRNKNVPSNHKTNKRRSMELELSSLTTIKEEIIKGKQVLLLDDVATKGISFKAGRQKLKEAGAILVAAIALGHTQLIY